MVGTTIGKKKESFTDLDVAHDVAVLAGMLSVLVLALEVMNVEARPVGLTINLARTKIQFFGDPDGVPQCASVQGNQVEVVESFTYLGSLIQSSGSSEPETKWRASLAREAMFALDGDPVSHLKPSSAFTIHVSFRYISMGWGHGQLLRPYQGRLTPWITVALGTSPTSTGQSLSPMMRFVPALGNHCCQTLSGVIVCPSLAISTEQIHARTTTELCRPAMRTLVQIGDEGLAVRDNHGSEQWRPTCVH